MNGSVLRWLGGKDVAVNNMVLFALFCYLGTLAIAQTAYGGGFMNVRWLSLSLLLMVAAFRWFSSTPRQAKIDTHSTTVVLIYLGMTFISVVTAENSLFSGLKWVSHAAMIAIFLVFLLQSLNLKQINQALNILRWVITTLIILSWLKPISTVRSQDIELFRGAFGSPNSMGQVAAIGCLLFLHSFLTRRPSKLRRAEIIIVCIAAWLVWSSGARSAVVACITGLVLMAYFYPAKLRGKAFWIILVAGALALAVPGMPNAVMSFVARGHTQTNTFSEQMFRTRSSVWTAAWEGFKKRPLLGWGFGADDNVSRQWEPKLTAIGLVSRDSVNDTLVALESTGIVGLMAYVLLVLLVVKQAPTRQQRFLISKIHGPPIPQRRGDFSAYHVHTIAFVISISLIVTVQFDNTALSAGNFISATLWLCVALAGAIKNKVVAYESAAARYWSIHKHLQSQPSRETSSVSLNRTPASPAL